MKQSVELMVGLQGSGKTFWATEEAKKDPYNTSIMISGKDNYPDEWFARLIKTRLETFNRIIIDGLYNCNDDIFSLLNSVHKLLPDIDLVIHYWELNREQCLINDRNRGRIISQAKNIVHLELDDPNTDSKLGKIAKIVNHKVYNGISGISSNRT